MPSDESMTVVQVMRPAVELALSKLLDLLDSETLLLPRMSVLLDKDPYEGFLGEVSISEIRGRMA